MRKLWFVKIALMAAVGITVFGYVVMLLWNNLVPVLFHGPVLTWAQALGLLVLSKILFHSFGGWRRGGHWRHRMQEKWANMTPEEKEKMREQWRHRCGSWGDWEKNPGGETKEEQ